MRKTLVVAGLMLSGLLLASPARAAIIANFTDGNGTSFVDQYQGVAGDGWANAWSTEVQNVNHSITPTVTNVNQLNGGGNYLSVTSTNPQNAAGVTVRRQYTAFSGVNPSQPHTIRFDFRPDVALLTSGGVGYNAIDNRYQAFGSTSPGNTTGGDNTWLAYVAPAGAAANTTGTWGFGDGGFSASTFVDSSIAMVAGTVYHFEITVDPASKTYVGSISDGVNSYTTPVPLAFRNGSATTGGEWLHFGRRQQGMNVNPASVPYEFSVDNISIVPEPSAFLMAVMAGMLLGIVGVHRRFGRNYFPNAECL